MAAVTIDAKLAAPVSSVKLAKTDTAVGGEVSCFKASPKKQFFQWTTAYVVTILTLAVFLADFVFLETSGETRAHWLSIESVLPMWDVVRSSKFFGLDCFISVTLLAVVGYQIFCRSSLGSSTAKVRAQGKRDRHCYGKPLRHGNGRHQEDAGAAGSPDGCKGAQPGNWPRVGYDNKTSPTRLQDQMGPVARLNQSIDHAAREGDPRKSGRLLLEFERLSNGNPLLRPDTVSYNLVIRAYAKKGDVKGAEDWLSRMETNGVEATVCSYNTVLDACAKSDNAEACEAWLKTMLNKDVKANVISYATAIYARARRGEEALAAAWLRKMIDAGIVPDAVCYNSMIHACGVCGNAAGAEHWIEEMQTHDLPASVTTFTAVIDACAKAVDVPRAEKWLEKMIAAGVAPNVVSFSAMIDACAKSSDATRAEYWHARMVECNVKPNAHSFSAVINACAKACDVDKAEEWLTRSENAGVAEDVVVYSSVIDACGKVGDAERAMAVFKRMEDRGIKAHIVAYAALARPFAYRGDWKEVERIACGMMESGIRPNEYFLYAQLLSYATTRPRQAERAEMCFRESHKLGLKANDHVVGALARAVGRDRCTELMAELCQGRPVPFPPARRERTDSNNIVRANGTTYNRDAPCPSRPVPSGGGGNRSQQRPGGGANDGKPLASKSAPWRQ